MKVSYKTGGSKPRPGVNRSYDDPNASHDSQRPFNYDSDYVNEVPQSEPQQPAADVTTGATDTDKKTSKKKSKKNKKKDKEEAAVAESAAANATHQSRAQTAAATTTQNQSPAVSNRSHVRLSPDIDKHVPTGLTPPSSRKTSPAPSDHQYPSLTHHYPYTSTLQSHVAHTGARRKPPYQYPTQKASGYSYRASPSPHRHQQYTHNMNWTSSSRGESDT